MRSASSSDISKPDFSLTYFDAAFKVFCSHTAWNTRFLISLRCSIVNFDIDYAHYLGCHNNILPTLYYVFIATIDKEAKWHDYKLGLVRCTLSTILKAYYS